MSRKIISPDEIAQSIIKSPKYKSIAPDAIRRIVGEEFAKTDKDCEKRARNRLHQIADAFINQTEQSKLRGLLESRELDQALLMHASTRERVSGYDVFAELIARHCPPGGMICDAACGLNPLFLGSKGYAVAGLDIQIACVDMINKWAQAENWPVRAQGADLIGMEELPQADLTLFMKLLPVLEAQRAGEGRRILLASRSPRVIVSFPTRSLGGRRVGMEQNYSERLEAMLPAEFAILERITTGNELFYALKRRNTDG